MQTNLTHLMSKKYFFISEFSPQWEVQGEIQISNLHFMRHGPQSIMQPLEV